MLEKKPTKKILMRILFSLLFALTSTFNLYSQKSNLDYRRSSLHMILIEAGNFPSYELVMKSWDKKPFPDKYNEHRIENISISLNRFPLTEEDYIKNGYLRDTLNGEIEIGIAENLGTPLKYTNNYYTQAVVLPKEKEIYQMQLSKAIKEYQIAHKMVARWFNRDDNGKFNMQLIQDRGFYDASEMEASIAQGQARGLASLGDAGEQLLNNTFVTFTLLEFTDNEAIAQATLGDAESKIYQNMAGSPQFMIDAALKVARKAYDKAKEGYTLWSKTYLYQLEWNDEIANEFYTNLWSNPDAFYKSDIFKLKFIDAQFNQSIVTFNLDKNRTQEEIIDLTLVRNLDNAFAKLQKKHDVFKPVVPIISSKPIVAQIGMKEGLEGGESFDVYELEFDPKIGKSIYKKVGRIQADKKRIWDNRYYAGQEAPPKNSDLKGTIFSGSSKLMPGMLIKQVK